jgi:hypothetical protein
VTSVRAALPFLDFSGELASRGMDLRDYSDLLLDPDWPGLCERVIEQIVGNHSQEKLGRLMPGLSVHPGAVVPTQMLSTRAKTVLGRRGIRGWVDLAALSPAELSDVRQAGTRTVNEILALALRFAAGPPRSDDGDPNESVTDIEGAKHESDAYAVAMVAGLRALATWAERERSATSISDLLTLSPELNAPDELVTAWRQLDIKVADLAEPELVEPTVSELFDALLAHLREGRRFVLEQRLLDEHPKTLEELGRIRGVTRQAISYDERGLKRDLAELLARQEFAPLRWRAWDLRHSLGALAPAAAPATVRALDRATRGVDERHRSPVRQLLLRLAGPYEARDGWFVRKGMPGVPTARDLWDAHSPAVVLDLEECRTWLSGQCVDPSHLELWLATMNGGRVLDGKLLCWSGSVLEKAIALLTLTGEPATPEELTERIAEGHNPRSVRNRLFEDPRVVRVDKHRVALRDWNMEEYSGIAEEIAQRIREHGGVAPLDEVVCDLVETFGVAESSVRAYAETPMFVRDANSVRLRGDHEVYAASAGELSECAGAYLLPDGGVSYAVRVDADVLRGSGRGCPRALALALGVAPGRERSFTAGTSEFRVTWPKASATGPALGSTRHFAEALGLRAGDYLRLTFIPGDQVVTATGSSAKELATAPSLALLEELTGLQTVGEDPRQVLGRAMGVAASTVDRVLRDRGDGRIAALLPQQDSDGDLDSALEGLAELLGSLD